MPMRSIPFKVVCLLGMNDGVYPPAEMVEGFDLMQNKTRPGDRSRRIDGRYMFLEALLSAQQALYISYVARSIRDNSEAEPSILVAELLEYCQQNYSLESMSDPDDEESEEALLKHIVQTHSMTPYSRKAFETQMPSFAHEWLPVTQANSAPLTSTTRSGKTEQWQLPSILEELDAPIVVELDTLQRFWSLPVKRYMNQRLGVYFDPFDAHVEDDEPFAMDGLGNYLLRQQLLEHALEKSLTQGEVVADVSGYLQLKRAEGVLPVGAFGELDVLSSEKSISALLESVLPHCSQQNEPIAVDLSSKPWSNERVVNLQGWLHNSFSSGLIRYRCGQLRPKYLLNYWIEHLAFCSSGGQSSTLLFGLSKLGVSEWRLLPVPSEYASAQLDILVKGYFSGLDLPLPFFINTAWEGAQVFVKAGLLDEVGPLSSDTGQKALLKMEQTFVGSGYRAGESADPYISRVWPQWDEQIAEQSYELMRQVIVPMLRYCETD
jgi:exodeoxyribonuclease V gamma subunit